MQLRKEARVYVYVPKDEKESVKLAANDLIKDISSVCGNAEFTDSVENAQIVICSAESNKFEKLCEHKVVFSHEEEFYYEIRGQKTYIFGADDFGIMWGIYAFSENELGIPPFYLFDGITPRRYDTLELEDKTVSEYPHTPFRGWFINDEDLLGGYMSRGRRNIDYAFYNDIVHPDLMEKIAETMLRYRMNLIIPATLINIANPDEENLVRIAARRGLYVSQHHIEPLGVSHFALSEFFEKGGYMGDISFITNKDAMISCWKFYAKKWAKYPRIVWQLGLRGNTDTPVWKSDKSVGNSDAERGKLISDAIQTQYDIISEAVGGKPFYTSSTVWMEGAKLLGGGHLKLPQDTIAVFADVGMSQMFGEDFFSVKRNPNRKYGVYYHAAYWHVGPHLSEGVLPQKMEYCYNLTREYKSDYYSVLNVANIKEFTYSAYLNAGLVWYGNKTDISRLNDKYCKLYAGENAHLLSEGIKQYFESFGNIGEQKYKDFCEKYDFNYHRYDNLSFPTVSLNDGIVCWASRIPLESKQKLYSIELGKTLRGGALSMERVKKLFDVLYEKLPANIRSAFDRQWRYQSRYWVDLFKASEEIYAFVEQSLVGGDKPVSDYYKRAAEYVRDIIVARAEIYTDEWQNWFAFEKKLNIRHLYNYLLTEDIG